MEYEWDEGKNEANIAKHGVSFEAIVDFQWDTAAIRPSDRQGEARWAAIGYIGNRLHHVVYTEVAGGASSACTRPTQGAGGDMSSHTETDLDRLPFTEYARIVAERGAKEHGGTLAFDELAASELTFAQIEAMYGEETAINAGIARDPDAPEWTAEDWARARPATEVVPHIVERYRRTRGKQKAPTKEKVTVRLDADILAHFREGGKGWQTRLNNTLRKAVLGG